MPDSDKPGVAVPEIPPRPHATAAAIAFILSLLVLAALLCGKADLATWLSVATVLATGATVYLTYKGDGRQR